MKIKHFSIIVLFILIIVSDPLFSQNKTKILVLGTAAKSINDIEDRLLRESVMRELLKKGFDIVPVMELEGEVQQNGLDLRNVPSSVIKNLSLRFEADFCVSGSIEKQTHNDLYLLKVYDLRDAKVYCSDIQIKKEMVFQDLCPLLSKKIADKTSEVAVSAKAPR